MVAGGKWQVDLYGMEDFLHEDSSLDRHKVKTIRWDTGADKEHDRNDCIDVNDAISGRVNSIRFTNSWMQRGELIPDPEL